MTGIRAGLCRFSVAFWLACAPPLTAVELFVSPAGSDEGAGTAESPLRSLEGARDRLRAYAASFGDPRTVTLRAGTYRLTRPLALAARDGGTSEFPTTYRAFPGETAVVSGALVVTNWRVHNAERSIYVADVPSGTESRDLFVNGVRRPRARTAPGFPGPFEVVERGIRVNPGVVWDWGSGGFPELALRWEWRDPRVRVMEWVADGPKTLLVLDPGVWRYLRPLLAPSAGGAIRYAENLYSFLDEPGEWFLAGVRGRLFYMPRDGEEMASLAVELALAERLLEIRGDGVDRPAENFRFEGLAFMGTTWLRPSRRSHVVSQANLISEWDPEDFYERDVAPESTLPTAAIELGHVRGVRFERCRWSALGSAGLNFYAGSQRCGVEGCTFERLGGAALHVGEPGERDRNNVNPEDERYLVRDIAVRNNFVRWIGEEYLGSVGIFVGFADSVTIAHNRLEEMPQSGISVGWGWAWEIDTASRNHRIEHNRLRNVVNSELNDGGAIYTLGTQPGTVVRGNYVRRQVRNYSGLYPDIGTAFVRFEDNVLREVPYWLLIHDPSTVSNVVSGNWSSTRHAAINDTGNRISGNRFVDDGHWPEPALTIVHRTGIEPVFADIQPRGIELVTPMNRAETRAGQAVRSSADVFGPAPEVRAVRFLVDEAVVSTDTDGADGWNGVWVPGSSAEVHLSAEVEWIDGTRQRSDTAIIRVRDGSAARVHVASTSNSGFARIVIDAADFAANWRDDGYLPEWITDTNSPAGSSGRALRALPDIGWVLDPPWLEFAPRLEYPVRLAGTEPLYVWVRLSVAGPAGSTIRLAFDGADDVVLAANPISNGWQWCGLTSQGQRARWVPERVGLHNLIVLMRDDGIGIDRIVLTGDLDFHPDGAELPSSEFVEEPLRPTLRLAVTDLFGQESPLNSGSVTLFRSGGESIGAVQVSLRRVGDAVAGGDFEDFPLTLTVSASAPEARIRFFPRLDDENESKETAGVRIEPSEAYLLTWPAEAMVSLRDATDSETGFWRGERFGSALAPGSEDSADADGDGVVNLLEEAFDMDPVGGMSERDARKLPRLRLGVFQGRACLYLRLYRPFSGRWLPTLTYAVEACDDPVRGDWAEVIPDWVGMDVPEYLGGVYPGRFERMRFSDPGLPEGKTARYYRVAVRRSPGLRGL